MLKPPIVFFIYNRPHTTKKVWEVIVQSRPEKIYVVADGPKADAEVQKVADTRAVVAQDPPGCTVVRLYSTHNMGLRQRLRSGLNFVFEHEESAIILEDDCLPHPSFFGYCQALLQHYAHLPEVMHIGGNNFQAGRQVGDGSYYFSIYSHIWGWATWARAWQQYDAAAHEKKEAIVQKITALSQGDAWQIQYWSGIADTIGRPDYTAWSYHWLFTLWLHGGKAIVPNRNLVRNIGFGPDATHTKHTIGNSILSHECGPIIHPTESFIDFEADNRSFYSHYFTVPKKLTVWRKIKWRISKIKQRFFVKENNEGL